MKSLFLAVNATLKGKGNVVFFLFRAYILHCVTACTIAPVGYASILPAIEPDKQHLSTSIAGSCLWPSHTLQPHIDGSHQAPLAINQFHQGRAGLCMCVTNCMRTQMRHMREGRRTRGPERERGRETWGQKETETRRERQRERT